MVEGEKLWASEEKELVIAISYLFHIFPMLSDFPLAFQLLPPGDHEGGPAVQEDHDHHGVHPRWLRPLLHGSRDRFGCCLDLH